MAKKRSLPRPARAVQPATEGANTAKTKATRPAGIEGDAPHVLLSYQQKWVADQADVAVWRKSRRVGASWADAARKTLIASSSVEAGGMDGLYIGYSEDMAREYIDDCAMWSRAYSLAAGEVMETVFADTDEKGDSKAIKAFRIDFASGFKVLALSSRPRSLRGKQGDVTIDEAAFHDDLGELLKAALAMMIWGGRVRILSSHNGEDNPFNQLCKEIEAGKLPYKLHTTTFSQALDAGLFDRVKLVMGKRLVEKTRIEWEAKVRSQYGEGAAEELDCIPRMGSGVYIPRTVVERAQVDGVPFLRLAKADGYELDDNRLAEAAQWINDVLKPVVDSMPKLRSVFGQDFGRDGDLSYCSVMQDEGAGHFREALALELRRIPFDVQHVIIEWLLAELPLFHHAKFDARGNGQAHAEALLQKFGPARVECVMATPGWYAANFPPYKAALEDKSVAIARGEDVIADHRRVVLKNGYPTMDQGRDKGSDGGYRHGDGVIARVLAWAAARAEGQPPAGASSDAPADALLPEAMRERRRPTMGFRRTA